MKHLSLAIFLFGLCLLPFISVHAFFDKDLHRLTMQDGLVDNTVSCIFKDKDGFMWFGTNNGVSRYDGKTVKSFSLAGGYMNITSISELAASYLGVISEGTLFVFDRKSERFIPIIIPNADKMQMLALLPDKNNTFWALSGKALKLFRWEEVHDGKGKLQLLRAYVDKEYKDLLPAAESFATFCYSPDHKELNLISQTGSLILFRPDKPTVSKTIKLVKTPPFGISSILDCDGIVWVSTIKQGIIRYHKSTGHIDKITRGGKGKEDMLSHTDAYQVIPINNNRYLAVTWGGYTLLMPDKENPEELTTEIYNNTASQMYRNLESRMLSAYYDPKGVLWIGTNGGGVAYSDLRSQFFNQYHQKANNEICGIVMDGERHLWLATYHEGIMRSDEAFDPMKRPQFTTVGTEDVRQRATVLCTAKDQEHHLWFGNRDGTITAYNEKTKQFAVYPLIAGGKRNTAAIWAIYMDRQKRFWVGTDNGLYRFFPSSGLCEKIPVEAQLKETPDIYIRAIAETKDGSIWLGTSNVGVCRFKAKQDGSIEVKSGYEKAAEVESVSVRSLLGSSDGNLYVGYMDGFAVISPQTDGIREVYTTRQGLCSNFIGCIVEDGQGRIWLGSNSGVSRYSRHQHLFYNYYIAGSNRSALFSDNMLFLGNNKSLTYFDPRDVEAYGADDKVYITELEVNNRAISIGAEMGGQTILTKGISYTDSIILSDANRDFSLAFNNLSYSEEQQKYNYRLLPYQEHWLVANDGEKASYTNLPEGEYTFEVKNIYPDGHNGAVTTLKIKILPHWSRTWPFRLLVFVCLVAAVAYLVRLIKKRQRRLEHEMQMKHELLTANLEREKEHQVRVERENFFTSAAHELRTPLTLILSPLQEILQQTKSTDPLYNRLSVMYKNGASLHTLVDHLLYVQKIEAGMVKLRLSETDVVELIKEVSAAFSGMAVSKGFRFEVSLPGVPLLLWIDAEKIYSAVQNLLSNAFKYTSPGGLVSLSVDKVVKDGKSFCRVVVSDTGVGINEELRERIFDSFITGDANPGFSTKVGIGLRIVKNTMDLHHGVVALDSTRGEGSVFTLLIPEGKEHFTGDVYEIVTCSSVHAGGTGPIQFPVAAGQQAEPETRKSLLIVEDNSDVREYIRSLFIHKYTVLEAKDGEEGVRMAAEHLPDLIISDVMMPVKDGFACCREIRARQETAHIPLLMLTAKAEDADVLQGSRSGADDYMMKPFNPEILRAKVENLILQRERLKRIYTKALMLKQESGEEEAEDSFMQQLINVVEANISDEAFSVKALADQLNMSQPTLYRKLKQHSELAAVDIIRSIRVSKAASLIMENRYSIQEISEMVGFNDVRTLRKHFTGQFGVSPSKYMEGKG
ncbi:hybrid sensor histidine kinase/response regulator transcription factor [Bacteroides sp.]